MSIVHGNKWQLSKNLRNKILHHHMINNWSHIHIAQSTSILSWRQIMKDKRARPHIHCTMKTNTFKATLLYHGICHQDQSLSRLLQGCWSFSLIDTMLRPFWSCHTTNKLNLDILICSTHTALVLFYCYYLKIYYFLLLNAGKMYFLQMVAMYKVEKHWSKSQEQCLINYYVGH
jgi:hypothetical protein